MNLAKKTTLAACIMLAIAFIFSCSSDDSNESGECKFNENSQIFHNGKNGYGDAYTGNGVIKMRFPYSLFEKEEGYNCDDIIEVGSVRNGVVTLASPLPTPPERCLIIPDIELEPGSLECSSQLLNGFKTTEAEFMLYEGEEYIGTLVGYLETPEVYSLVLYWYISKNVDKACSGESMMDMKAGWNKIYLYEEQSSTDCSILTNEVKWTLR